MVAGQAPPQNQAPPQDRYSCWAAWMEFSMVWPRKARVAAVLRFMLPCATPVKTWPRAEQRRGWPEKRGVRHRRPSAKVKEHKDARSLERRIDMEVSRSRGFEL